MSGLRVVSETTTTMAAPVAPQRWLNNREAATYLGIGLDQLLIMRRAWRAEHGTPIELLIGLRAIRFRYADLDRLLVWWSARQMEVVS